ncbi:MAG: O-antigen ligase family protein [Planctomycetota bacterium]
MNFLVFQSFLVKHFLFMTVAIGVGALGGLISPFWPLLLYYGLATLRPQHIWHWSLNTGPELRWSLIAAFALLGSVMLHFSKVWRQARLGAVLLCVLAYTAFMTMSVVTADDPYLAQAWAMEYGKVLLVFFLASLIISKPWHLWAVGGMVLLCIGYHAYSINAMYFFEGGRLDVFHHGFGGLDNNGAGAFIAMGVPFAYVFGLMQAGRMVMVKRVFAVFLGLLMMHAVMMTYSRGAMVALSVALIWLLVHHRPRKQALVGLAALSLAVAVMAGPEIRDRFMSTKNFQEDESAQSRFDAWGAAWRIAWDEPLLGRGVRNSNRLSYNFGADMANRTIHNQYLQLAADSGIPAALAYVLAIGLAFYGFGRARKTCLFEAERLHGTPARGDPPLISTSDPEAAAWGDRARLCLALQASLLCFMVAALFLSAEAVELPWMLMALGGLAPVLMRRESEQGLKEDEDAPEAETEAEPEPEPGVRGRVGAWV